MTRLVTSIVSPRFADDLAESGIRIDDADRRALLSERLWAIGVFFFAAYLIECVAIVLLALVAFDWLQPTPKLGFVLIFVFSMFTVHPIAGFVRAFALRRLVLGWFARVSRRA